MVGYWRMLPVYACGWWPNARRRRIARFRPPSLSLSQLHHDTAPKQSSPPSSATSSLRGWPGRNTHPPTTARWYEAEGGFGWFGHMQVGHGSIAAMAQCMGLPLLRRRITGTSKHVGLEYAATAGDEVEDLRALLVAAQRLYAVEAVSTGAIASDYQRLRVESVCASLGLVSLGFLWRVSQRVRRRHRRRVARVCVCAHDPPPRPLAPTIFPDAMRTAGS